MSDIAWRDTSGNVAFWLMNGAAVLDGRLRRGARTWSIVGQRDFNGDGKADLLWHDTSGKIAMWFMYGMAVGSSVSAANILTNGPSLESATSMATVWPTSSGATSAAMSRCG